MKSKHPKTYEANYKDKKIRVTVPEAIDEGELFAALKDNFSPQAVAAIAYCIQHHSDLVRPGAEVDRQLNWLTEELIQLLGGQEAYRQVCKDIL